MANGNNLQLDPAVVIRLTEALEKLDATMPPLVKALVMMTGALVDGSEGGEALEKVMSELGGSLGSFGALADSAADSVAKAEEAMGKYGDRIQKALGIQSNFLNSISQDIALTLESTKARKNLIKGLKEGGAASIAAAAAFNLSTRALSTLIAGTAELAAATDDALVAFNKQTGAFDLYGREITNLEKDMMKYNVTIVDVAKSYTSMTTNVTDLNKMSKASRKELGETTAILNELGVESDITTENFQFMTKVLGKSARQANRTSRDLFVLARAIGMPPQQMAQDFTAAMPKLAAFGSSATDVFQKLAVNARASGMSVEQMLNITEKFDKFDTAAEAVGRLNAALGGPYLSTLEMVTTTDPTERMKKMADAINSAGRSFDNMEYYERKMIATSMGLSDVNELALVMRGEFDLLPGAIKKSSSEIINLAQQTADYNTVIETMTTLMRQVVIQLGPVINGIKNLTMGLIRIINYAPSFKLVLAGMAAAFTAFSLTVIAGIIAIMFWTGVLTAGILPVIQLVVAALAVLATGIAATLGLVYSYLGNLGDIFDSTNLAASGLKIAIIGLLAVFALLSGPLGWTIAVAAAMTYAWIQVFVYWQEIVDGFMKIIKPLQPRIKELQKRFGELGDSTQGAGTAFETFGNVVLWALEHVIYALIDSVLTLFEVFMPVIEILDIIIMKSGAWKVILAALALATLIILSPLIALVDIVTVLLKIVTWLLQKWRDFADQFIFTAKAFAKFTEYAERVAAAINEVFSSIHALGVGLADKLASPGLLELLDMTAARFGILGEAIAAPLRPLAMLLDKMREFAEYVFKNSIFGKAFGMISSLTGAAFGAEVSGSVTGEAIVKGSKTGKISKGKDHALLAEAIGKEVSKQIVEAWKGAPPLEGKIAIDTIFSPTALFNFVSRGFDLQQAGKPINVAKMLGHTSAKGVK